MVALEPSGLSWAQGVRGVIPPDTAFPRIFTLPMQCREQEREHQFAKHGLFGDCKILQTWAF